MRERLLPVSDIPDNLTEKHQPRRLQATGEQPTLSIRRLSEVEALAVWTVLDYPLSSCDSQELQIVLKAKDNQLGGWVVYAETQPLR